MTFCGLWLRRGRLTAVLVGTAGEVRRPVRAAPTDEARFGLLEHLLAAEVEVVVTDALARADVLPGLLARRGLRVWIAGDGLALALVAAAGVRDPARSAAVLARLPRIPLLRTSLRRLTPQGAAPHQLDLL